MTRTSDAARGLALWFPDLAAERLRRRRSGTRQPPVLVALRRWAGRLSPRVGVHPPDGLLVDLTGCSYPFGDEPGLLAVVGDRCRLIGLTVRMAVADTPGAAWALARHAADRVGDLPDGRVVPILRAARQAHAHGTTAVIALPGMLRDALAPLPVAGLRLPDETLAALGRVGLHRIGDLAGLPRGAVERRFGAGLLQRLDQAMGLEPEAIPAMRQTDRRPARPDGDPPGGDRSVQDLILRLAARLGDARVTRLHPAESRIPEKSALVLSAAWSAPHEGSWPAPPGPRPLVLHAPEPLDAPINPMPPAGFVWRGRDHALRQAAGPERIAPEWWLDDPEWRTGARDYWRAETAAGDRLWLFYAHGGAVPGGWFCQGAFA